jgi:hypothetical protein
MCRPDAAHSDFAARQMLFRHMGTIAAAAR